VTDAHRSDCRCRACLRARRLARRGDITPDDGDRALDEPWLLVDFPVALIARAAWPDDDEAIAAAFGDA
jgi:hypothetical protein